MVPSDIQGFDTDLSGVVSINRVVVVVEEEQRYNEKGSGFSGAYQIVNNSHILQRG